MYLMSRSASPGTALEATAAAAAIPPPTPQPTTSQQNGSNSQRNGTTSRQNGTSSKQASSGEGEAISAAEEFRIDEQNQVDKDNLAKKSKAAGPESTQGDGDRRHIERNQAAVAQMRKSRQAESSLDSGGSQNSSAAAGAPVTDGRLDSQTERIAISSAKGVVSVAAEAGKVYRRIADVSRPILDCNVFFAVRQ